MSKRWRVTQYSQLTKRGEFFLNSRSRAKIKTAHRDYWWLWMAKFSAWIHRGESAGFGLYFYTTEITDLQEDQRV